ncbi:MAG TPA: hypothetical protein VFV71_04080 [Burkholderiales bacterium]|nr:hypothetical protein [Burkholderiales bacterium]
MKPHRALIHLLVLLLLFVQQAAFAHAISHLGKNAPAKEQLAHSKLCDKCLSFEKVSGATPVGAPAPIAPAPAFQPPRQADYAFVVRTAVVFHGRAPPVFL